MSKIAALKTSLLNQDIGLSKRLQLACKWEESTKERSKFQSHPRTIESESEEEEDSSASSIHVDSFKENIIRQTLQNKLIVKDFTDIFQETFEEHHPEPLREVTTDYIFGGDSLDFAENYDRRLKNKLTEKYVEDAVQKRLSKERKTKVTIVETKNVGVKKKMKILSRKTSDLQKNDMLDSIFDSKFRTVTEKMITMINDTIALMDKGVDKPDGEEDYLRRLTRVKEFSSRFVRNYLYPLNQQIKAFDGVKGAKNQNQRLITCYQLIFQGIHSYHNHLPTSVGNCASDKLNNLMKNTLEIIGVHSNLIRRPEENISTDYVYALKMHAEKLMKRIEDFGKSTNNSFKTQTIKTKKSTNVKQQHRYAMYTNATFYRKDLPYRRSVEALNKKKLNVKSKYKTATFKHRPPLDKTKSTEPSKFSLLGTKSSSAVQSTPVQSGRLDDRVETQIGVENSAPHPSPKTSTERMIHDDVKVKLLQLVQDGEEVLAGSDMLHNYFRNKEGKEILQVLAKELQKEHENGTLKKVDEVKLQNEMLERKLSSRSTENVEDKSDRSPRKEPTITVTGPKNAKLICITDENSVAEEQPKPEKPKIEQTGCSKCTINPLKPTKPVLKMSRLPKVFRSLSFFSDQHAINIIEYKLKFRNVCKKNPLYMKTTNIQPWILMGKLSDEILDYAVLQVAKEIELTSIPDQIYKEEMQL